MQIIQDLNPSLLECFLCMDNRPTKRRTDHLKTTVLSLFLCIFLSFRIVGGHEEFMGYTGPVQMGYGARTFYKHINNRVGTFFRKHMYGASTFYELFFTLDTIYADNKDKPMAGYKNQLIKKCLRKF